MTLSHLGRRSTVAAAALSLALAAALVGCSAPAEEPEEAPEPVQQEQPAPEPEPEPEAEPVDEKPAVDKTQLVASETTYSELQAGITYTTAFAYDDEGRLIKRTWGSYADASWSYDTSWTYDASGNLLTEETSYLDEAGEPITSTITWSYNSDGLPTERLYETNEPGIYIDPETGEELSEEEGGVFQPMDDPRRTFSWTNGNLTEEVTTYGSEGETRIETCTYDAQPTVPCIVVSTDPKTLGSTEEALRPVSIQDGDSTTTLAYNADGSITSMKQFMGDTLAFELTHRYDSQGNLTETVHSWGEGEDDVSTSEWTYDSANRPLASVSHDADLGTSYTFFTYDSAGRLKTVTSAWPDWETGEYYIDCTVYDYAAENEELSTTPEQLIADARATVEAA